MKHNSLVLGAGLLAAALSIAHADDLKSETRQVGPFNGVELRGAAKVDLTVGPAQSVVIEAEPDVLAHITTDVRGTTLVVDRKQDWWPDWDRKKVLVHITMPKLASFALEGTADALIAGLNGGTTAFSIDGTGSMKGTGKLDKLTLALNGTGSVDFAGLPVDTAAVGVNGTGSVHLMARHSLAASVNGVGSIVYQGSPEHLSTSINGIGSIKQVE